MVFPLDNMPASTMVGQVAALTAKTVSEKLTRSPGSRNDGRSLAADSHLCGCREPAVIRR
jgi:hypothetical protein